MKKNQYIAPEMEVVEMEASAVLAASIAVGEGEADAEQSFSNRHRGEWGNLWADDKK